MQRRQFNSHAFGAALAAALPWGAGNAFAAAPMGPGGYPDKPIRIVVPYPAGGVVDAVIRAVADPLSAEMPQRVVTENRPGADGRIGMDAVAKAQADGYLLLAASPLLAVGEHLMPDMKGRSKDFAGVCAIAAAPTVYIVPNSLPVKTLKEFVALAAAKPGELNIANPGTGSSIHLAQELFFERTGIKVTNINYKGQPPSLIDLGAGQLQMGLISQNLALPLIQAGKVRALAVNAAKRTRSLPDVPTVAEAGFPDVLVQSWYGVAAPAKTPAPIVAYLSQQFQRALAMPEIRGKLEGLDAEIMALDGPKFDTLIEKEYLRWGELIRKRKITM
jgi:tripartite-type tricarboxylate transporter receptor subunit TctC